MSGGNFLDRIVDRVLPLSKAIRPEEVFTPRSAEVNPAMYVDRPEYQQELRRAIRSGYSVIIYGESGCGKSWLYKKVFEDESIFTSRST